MTKSNSMVRSFPLFIFCDLLVIAVLAACGTATSNTNAPSVNTVTPTVSDLTNSFQGEGFTIHYPNQWTKDSDSAGDSVYFRDSSSSYHWLAVRVEGVGSNPEDTDELSTAYNDVLYELGHGSQCQKDTGLANTTSINGISWTQVEEVCAVVGTSNSPPALTIHVLVTTHSQKYYIVDEVAPPDVYEHLSRTIYQPMLQSITFH